MSFVKASKKKSKARIGLIGVSGSGKTYTALSIAKFLGDRVAVIDTERGSASKYSDLFSFDVNELDSHNPQTYIDAIKDAESAGYDVLVIDSLSHAWMGKDGALEMVDNEQRKGGGGGNSFTAWRNVTPLQNKLIDAIVNAKLHVIVTLRAKTEYIVEKDSRGKSAPRKVGLAPVQRDGLEYEFDIIGTLSIENDLVIDKSRCPALSGQIYNKAGKDVALIIRQWLDDGAIVVDAPKAEVIDLEPIKMVLRGQIAVEKAETGEWGGGSMAALKAINTPEELLDEIELSKKRVTMFIKASLAESELDVEV